MGKTARDRKLWRSLRNAYNRRRTLNSANTEYDEEEETESTMCVNGATVV